MSTYRHSKSPSRLKLIILPAEHGSWGMLFESIVLGLWLSPLVISILVSMIAISLFMMRPPIKIIISDWQRNRRLPRTVYAQGFVFLYVLIICTCGLGIIIIVPGAFLTSFLLSRHGWLILLIVFLVLILRLIWGAIHGGKDLISQILGGMVLSSITAVIVSVGGWAVGASLILWMVLSFRVINSVFYVRTRIRLDRGKSPSAIPTVVVHLVGVLIVVVLAMMNYVSYLAVFPLVILLIRMGLGLSSLRRKVRAQIIGFQELGYGVLTVILLACAF